jgi:hypothetical protein
MVQATTYGMAFPEPKLRALAKMNVLPSSWFLRERTVRWLRGRGKEVQDGFVEDQVEEAKALVRRLEEEDDAEGN